MSRHSQTYRVLYVGALNPGQTAGYRAHAIRDLGHEVIPFNTQEHGPRKRLHIAAASRYPAGPLVAGVNARLRAAIREHRPTIVWFDKPVYFTPKTALFARSSGAFTICFNQDNPFGPRNDGCWLQVKKTIPLFDLHCLVRDADVRRYAEWKLPFVKIQFSFEPRLHYPPPEGWSDAERDREVSYIGSPYEDRPDFLAKLAECHQVPITVAGPSWSKVRLPETLQLYVREGYLAGNAYREAIWRSKINLSFVTHLNEDDVAHKAFEIAACQGFLLAVRTPGHLACFKEDEEAVFFSTVEECAQKARYYLDHPAEREAIAQRGRERAVASGYDNLTQLRTIFNAVDARLDPASK